MGGGAIAWYLASITVVTGLPAWPAPVMGGVALVAVMVLFFGPSKTSALDKHIRRIDGQIEAAVGLRLALQDDLTNADDLQREYDCWRDETLRALPRGWRSDFTNPNRQEIGAFAAARVSDSEQAYLLVELEWDLHKLREIKRRMLHAPSSS
jgi:hypothetical protein